MTRTTVVSAPGKVLIAGGYLVLDPAYSGVVVSTSSRFYATVREELSLKPTTIRVRSPQFIDATWSYSATVSPALEIRPFEEKLVTSETYDFGAGLILSDLAVRARINSFTLLFSIHSPLPARLMGPPLSKSGSLEVSTSPS